jgi:hypothetical protein
MNQYSAFGVDGNAVTGPESSVSYTGPIVMGMAFKVTEDDQFLYGYSCWRSDSGQPATADFALWEITGATTGTVITDSDVSISDMIVGEWNYVALPTPLALTSETSYKAVLGIMGNFNDTAFQFRGGDPYVNGIVNGPLTIFSTISANDGTNPEPNGTVQETYDTSGEDPTAHYPTLDDNGGHSSNFWLDVLVGPSDDVADSGTGSAQLSKMSVTGSGQLKIPGSGSAQLSKMSVTGSGQLKIPGSGSAQLSKMSVTGSGQLKISGAGGVQLPKMGIHGRNIQVEQDSSLFVFSPL